MYIWLEICCKQSLLILQCHSCMVLVIKSSVNCIMQISLSYGMGLIMAWYNNWHTHNIFILMYSNCSRQPLISQQQICYELYSYISLILSLQWADVNQFYKSFKCLLYWTLFSNNKAVLGFITFYCFRWSKTNKIWFLELDIR